MSTPVASFAEEAGGCTSEAVTVVAQTGEQMTNHLHHIEGGVIDDSSASNNLDACQCCGPECLADCAMFSCGFSAILPSLAPPIVCSRRGLGLPAYDPTDTTYPQILYRPPILSS